MVDAREPAEWPDPSDELAAMTVEEILAVTLRDAESDGKREAMMWKSAAAENVEDHDERPRPPSELEHLSDDELEALALGEAGEKEEMVRLLEWAVYPMA